MLELAKRAAGLWPLRPRRIALAAHRENAVFKVEVDGGVFALRLHRQGYRRLEELESELAFMVAMEEAGIAVPRPILSNEGKFIETVGNTQVSMLSWLAGEPLGSSGMPLEIADRTGTFWRFGQLVAKLHEAADRWDPPINFARQPWDCEGLLGEAPQWGRFWDNPHLTKAEARILSAARGKLRANLSARTFDLGAIHADLVSENVLLDGDRLQIIDFDDCGFGYRLQDAATALVKHQSEPDFAALRSAFCDGYMRLRPMDVSGIDLFLLIRHLSYVGWIVPRLSGEDGMRRCRKFIVDAVPMAERFLEASTN
jgi:Ser/Thr protein kinase RdoA (MazF antagonist)